MQGSGCGLLSLERQVTTGQPSPAKQTSAIKEEISSTISSQLVYIRQMIQRDETLAQSGRLTYRTGEVVRLNAYAIIVLGSAERIKKMQQFEC